LNSTLKSLLFWMVLVVVGVLIWNFSTQLNRTPKPISLTEFLQRVDKGEVLEVTITGNDIEGRYTTPGPDNTDTFRTYAPTQFDTTVGSKLEKANVSIKGKDPTSSPWANLLYYWAPILLMIGFWIFIMRQMQSGGNKALSFGKSRAKLSSSSQKKVTFKDVSGVDEAKEELQEIIEFPKAFS
jgi:cell division protease FtsH